MIDARTTDNSLSLWYAIHTHLHQETRAEANLEAWHVGTFYPKVKSKRRNEFNGAITYITKPLFPGYLFARFELGQLLNKVSLTRGVASVVSFAGTPCPIEDEVIEFIRQRADNNGFVQLDEPLKPGDKVVMKGGMLDSLSGVFEREMNDSERVMILLQTISYQGHIIVEKNSIQRAAL